MSFDSSSRPSFSRSDKRKPKPWSHQRELEYARGRQIILKGPSLDLQGRLLDADQFTFKLQIPSAAPGADLPSPVIVYKSSVTYFQVV